MTEGSDVPVVHIHVRSGRSAEVRRRLLDAVGAAVCDTLEVPRSAARVLLTEVPPEHYLAGEETLAERDQRLEGSAS